VVGSAGAVVGSVGSTVVVSAGAVVGSTVVVVDSDGSCVVGPAGAVVGSVGALEVVVVGSDGSCVVGSVGGVVASVVVVVVVVIGEEQHHALAILSGKHLSPPEIFVAVTASDSYLMRNWTSSVLEVAVQPWIDRSSNTFLTIPKGFKLLPSQSSSTPTSRKPHVISSGPETRQCAFNESSPK